ncbi:hypothetical protein M3I54_37490 [Paraburkholderia sp. CNPSo 3274]|uniref:hypothetical protein n=1 Tax=unclassified Paraburkholderia TaxID=2615204 RepID=UPI0020B8D4D6|nr:MULTISPECIES: hypothetical protein [unclassified Paraburkholderia]MCP3712548.1 hypothetical protein [Paraburkholderia sp. CNPSo 3274]MCP3718650.1 hypothetical protein [Paraburkholderia sp. CNPSo 3281]
MPVDLSPAGRPSAYPRRPRIWPWWFCIWLACNVFGVAIAMLLWPKGQAASGGWFWLCFIGFPNGAFLILFAIERAGYEGLWYRAYWRNYHRGRWLAERLRTAQRPLQVLGFGCCLPLGEQTLAGAIAAKKRVPASQMPRAGMQFVEHARFEDTDWLADEPVSVDPFADDETMAGQGPAKQVPLLTLKIAKALEPLEASLRALTVYERQWWPQVRVLSEPGRDQADVAMVTDALRIGGLPPLAVQAVAATDGLMVADAWLDAKDARPLLVVATAWHEAEPPEGSTEGCVAVLMTAGYFRLPDTVKVAALLHRPVTGLAGEVEYGFANAAVWGKADFASIVRAWITRPVDGSDKALRAANMDSISKDEAQRRPDRIAGDLGDANGWLSIIAAIESGAADGPQLIIDGLQSAVLRVTPATTDSALDNNRNTDERPQAFPALA